MKLRSIIAALALTTPIFLSTLALAQQPQNPSQRKAGTMGRGMSGGMMGQMMAQHQDMSELMMKMTQSMTAINSEKDPAKLKTLLAEHSALLEQMRNKMSGQGKMMQNMASNMTNCPGMTGASQPVAK